MIKLSEVVKPLELNIVGIDVDMDGDNTFVRLTLAEKSHFRSSQMFDGHELRTQEPTDQVTVAGDADIAELEANTVDHGDGTFTYKGLAKIDVSKPKTFNGVVTVPPRAFLTLTPFSKRATTFRKANREQTKSALDAFFGRTSTANSQPAKQES